MIGLGAMATIGGGLLGALAGGQKSNTEQGYNTVVAPEGALEKQAGQVTGDQLTQFGNLINQGPGQAEVQGGLAAQQQLAAMLQQFAQGGFMPNQQDYGYAQQLTNNVFAPEQMALQQRFQDAQVHGDRAAARMGRGAGDPVLMNKLLQEQTRQQQMLGSQMTSYMGQQANQMPQQRLGFMNQFAQVQSGLASQAMQNRQALFSMGAQLKNQEQQFRANTASRSMTTSSGGGLMGMLSGGLAGIGAAAGAVGKLGGMFGGGDDAPGKTTTVAESGAGDGYAGMGGGAGMTAAQDMIGRTS